MSLNQLYHDHGVAQTRAQHSGTIALRAEHAAEAVRVHYRIRTKRADHTADCGPDIDRFEVFRADEVQVSSTKLAGGDWRWRLTDAADETLVEGGGYRSQQACLRAVSLLRDRAGSAG